MKPKADKWKAKKQYVDIDTAEIISEYWYKRKNYSIIKKEKHYEFKDENYRKIGTIIHTIIIKEGYQSKLL